MQIWLIKIVNMSLFVLTLLVLVLGLIEMDFFYILIWASLWEKRSSGFPTRLHTNQAVRPHKMARGLKFRIKEVEGLYYCRFGNVRDNLIFSLIFRNSLPREFKVLSNIENT